MKISKFAFSDVIRHGELDYDSEITVLRLESLIYGE